LRQTARSHILIILHWIIIHTYTYPGWDIPESLACPSPRGLCEHRCFPWNVSMILCLLWLLLNKAIGYFFAQWLSWLKPCVSIIPNSRPARIGSKVHIWARGSSRACAVRLSGVGPCKVPRLPRLGWLGCQDMGATSRDLRLTMRK
jgi:hypothetical protein